MQDRQNSLESEPKTSFTAAFAPKVSITDKKADLIKALKKEFRAQDGVT